MSRPIRPQPGAAAGDDELRPRNLAELARLLELPDPVRRPAAEAGPLPGLVEGIASVRATIGALEHQLRMLRLQVAALERMVAPGARAGGIDETWSPAPVLGYRVWMIRDGQLRGLRVPWPQPVLEARCRAERLGTSGIPHTGGECGRLGPGCGIYALKDVEPLVSRPRPFIRLMDGVLLGLVALSGKVVEHDRGYRAERARVVAAAVLGVGKLSLGSDPAWIEGVFEHPAGAHLPRPDLPGEPPHCRDLRGLDDGLVRRLIADYLRDEARRRTESWT